mmetsp:Transcript_44574/g.104703  ORF Transcript_44574/g.104703 Transcript_44574/m.104703 type:complete len:325 (+) Transcript_44574:153-1127(+)
MTGSATRVFAVVTPRGWTGSRCRAPKDETEPGVQALTATFHSRVRCRRWRTKWFLALSCFSVLRCSFAGVPDINPGASRALRAESHRKHAPPALRQLRIQALSNQHKVVSPIASDGSQILGTSLESPRARKARSRIRRRLPRRRKPVLSRHMREGGDDSRIACKVCLADVQLKCSEGSSTGVLKCPQCCDLIHERCMVPILEQNSAPSCPSCRFGFDGVDTNTSSFWVPEEWQLSQRWWNSFWDSDDPDYCASSADDSLPSSPPLLSDADEGSECKGGRERGRGAGEGCLEVSPRRSPRKQSRDRVRMVLDADDTLHCLGPLSC